MDFRVGRNWKVSVAVVAAVAAVICSGRIGDAQSPAAPTVATVKLGARTLTILQAGWQPLAKYDPGFSPPNIPSPPVVFVVKFAISGPSAPDDYFSPPAGRVSIDAEDSAGHRVRAQDVGQGDDVRVWNAFPDLVDPRLPRLKLHFQLTPARVPRAPGDSGPEIVAFDNVPMPLPGKELLPLTGGPITRTTPSGLRFKLDRGIICPSPFRSSESMVEWGGRWLPPENDPGADVSVNQDEGLNAIPPVQFDSGPPPRNSFTQFSVGNVLHPGQDDSQPGQFFVTAPLAPGATSATLRFKAERFVPNWSSAGAVSADVSLPMPAPPPANSRDTPPIAVEPLGDGKLCLDPMRFVPGSHLDWHAQVRAVMPKPQFGDTRWAWTNVEFKFSFGSSGFSFDGDVPFRPSGAALKPNETAYQAVAGCDARGGGPPPTHVDVISKWQQVKTTDFHLEFNNVPLPVPGQIIRAQVSAKAGKYGTFVVRRVGWFTEANSLSRWVANKLPRLVPPYGLAVMVEHIPDHPEASFLWGWPEDTDIPTSWNLSVGTGTDSRGRGLVRPAGDGAEATAPGYDLEPAGVVPAGDFATYYLLPPKPGAKSFRFSLDGTRREILRDQTVTFANVPLPAPTGSAK